MCIDSLASSYVIAKTDISQEEIRFRELCKKYYDIAEYISEEEKKFVEDHREKYVSVDSGIKEKFDNLNRNNKSLHGTTSLTTSGPSDVSRAFLKAKKTTIEKEGEGNYLISPELLYYGHMKNGYPYVTEKNVNTVGTGKIVNLVTKKLVYEGEIDGNHYDGKGKVYRDGFLYEEGKFVGGLIHEGIRYNSNGTLYAGNFENNEFCGNGRLVFPSGFYITGNWKEGKPVSDIFINYDSLTPVKSGKHFGVLENNQGVYYKEKDTVSVFYYNGNIFVGSVDKDFNPTDGIMYQYNESEFIPMSIGKYDSRGWKAPYMEIKEEKFKRFYMK